MDNTYPLKLFVGGISRQTTEESLREHFGVFGTVVSCLIPRNMETNFPKGIAFVYFSDPDGVDKALREASHVILGRKVEVKRAIPKHNRCRPQQEEQSFRTKKIFVGGLPADLTEEEFKANFEQFGSITDVVVMRDYLNRPRGFGFLTFDSEEAVENVTQNNFYELKDKQVEVQKAIPKVVYGPGYNLNNYQQGNYPMYSPNGFPYYGYGYYDYSLFGAIGYGGGFPIGGYSGNGYGPLLREGPLPYGRSACSFMHGGDGLCYGCPACSFMHGGDWLCYGRPAGPYMHGGDGWCYGSPAYYQGQLMGIAPSSYNSNVVPAPTGSSSQVSYVNDRVEVQSDVSVDASLSSIPDSGVNGIAGQARNDQVEVQNHRNGDVSLSSIADKGANGVAGEARNDQVEVQDNRNGDVSLSSIADKGDNGIAGEARNDQVEVQNHRNGDVSLSSAENGGGELIKQNQSDTSASNMI